MKNLISKVTLIILVFSSLIYSQQKEDSLYTGRTCNIILFSGFEAEGRITGRNDDSVFLKTDLIELRIPLKEIRIVTETGITLQHVLEREDNERMDAFIAELRMQRMNREKAEKVIMYDTSELCNVHFENNSELKNVNLIALNDTVLEIIQNTAVTHTGYQDIRKIVFRSKRTSGLYGGIIGSMTSFILSYFLFSNLNEGKKTHGWDLFFSSIAAIPGYIIGTGLGLETSEGEKYIFGAGDTVNKTKKIKYVIHKYRK